MGNSKGKTIGAFVVMGLLGAIAGVLFAPEKAKKTRSMLFSGAKDMADELTEKVKHEGYLFKGKVNSLKDLAEEKVSDMVNKAKEKLEGVS
jgi:gas vesicle protein